MLIQTRNTSHCKFGAYQKWEPAGCRVDFGIFFYVFAKSALLPFIPRRSRLLCYGILCMKTLYNVVNL